MRKFTYFTQSFAVLLLLVLSSCASMPDPEPISDKYARPDEVIAAGVPVLNADGKPIYTPTDGNFRYAGTLFANADGTLSAWFTTPGGTSGASLPARVSLNSGDGGGGPYSLGTSGTDAGAIYYPFEESFYGWAVRCPGWSAPAYMTVSIYLWAGDYNSTIAGTPLGSVDFAPYADNSWLELNVENSGYGDATGNAKFPAGEYLLFGQRLNVTGVSNQPGFWGGGRGEIARMWYKGAEMKNNEGFQHAVQYTAPAELGFSGQIKYFTASSSDVQATWSDQLDDPSVAPTSDKADKYYAKSASIVKVGNYYYMAYQGSETYNENTDNYVFIARSETKEANNWEKWNGSGWGGDPAPAFSIDFSDPEVYFGAGEPSLVVKDGVIYLYYTYNVTEGGSLNTYLMTADATDENWPANLSDKGLVLDRSAFATTAMDGASVVYSEESNSFIAIHSVNNNNVNSYFAVWQSTDGISGWTHVGTVYSNARVRARYPRFVVTEENHVSAATPHMILYQFGSSQSNWQTYMSSYSFAQ